MAGSVKEMLAEADATVARVDPAGARESVKGTDIFIVDVREPSEVEKTGRIKGAVNVSRGMLEFRADPESPYHDPAFDKDKTVLLYCAVEGRSALAGKTLQDMGYRSVFNIGGLQIW